MSKEETTIDDLARMVAEGFNGMEKRFTGLENRMDILERGQEDIKLRLDNVAYRFELQDLDRRVTRLEKKASF